MLESFDNYIMRVKHLTKEFPGVRAVDDVSIDFKEGEVHCLVGENGAGKSTLIKMMSGYYAPTSGTIEVNHISYDAMNVNLAMENGIQVIYQEFMNVEQLTAAENVFLGIRTNQGIFVDFNERKKKAKEIFNELGVNIDPDQPVYTMSPAQKQIVEIAKAISKNVKILIMDEPTAPLTIDEVNLLFEIIKKLKKKGVTIIYISHRLDELFEIGDCVTVLRDGQFIVTKDIKDVTKESLITYMVGRKISQGYPKRKNNVGDELLRVENLSGNGDKNINFTLHRGEILGFGGLVGAGRTELMEVLYGYKAKESGKIYYKGKLTQINDPRKAMKTGIGFVQEDRKGKGVFLNQNVGWNITINGLKKYCKHGWIIEKKINETAQKYVKQFNIKTTSIKQKVINLSGGNQQKVSLAKAMDTEPEIIIFDEPTRGIDVGAKQEIYELMNQLAGEGKGILMVSSDMPELLGMCDRILVIAEGKQTGIVEKSEFSQERIMELASVSSIAV